MTEARDTKQVKLPVEYQEEQQKKSSNIDRRRFMNYTGWLGILGSLGIALLGFLRFLFPRVLFEPRTEFKAGNPNDYAVGQVDTRYLNSERVYIIREEDGFYALSGICTHLGCTPAWLASDNKFKCPCHGSGFKRSGVNFEGPAPRPLERLKINLAEDGQLLIEKGKIFRQEKDEWNKPDAFLYL